MSTSLRERVFAILEGSDFNELPYEEKMRIKRYTDEQQILTLYQVLVKYETLTTKSWRIKISSWLKNCVDDYLYGEKEHE